MCNCWNWWPTFSSSNNICWLSNGGIICIAGIIIGVCVFLIFILYATRYWKRSVIRDCSTNEMVSGFFCISLTDSARDILDKRFALGKITKDEYEEMKKNSGAS